MAFNPLAGLMPGAQQGASASPAPSPPEQGSGDAISYLKDALDSLQKAQDADSDPAEDAAIAAVAAKIKTLIAGRAKQKEAAMGTTPAHKFVARQSGASSAGY